MNNSHRFSSLMLWLGLAFIYLPMIILVIYSFNASRLVTVWGGWSVHWYIGLLDNSQLMGSVKRSLQIAFYTATAAVALGVLAAFAMTRIKRFRGRTVFSGMVTAPLVMPEVITGLSLLLLFVAMAQLIGWPAERGMPWAGRRGRRRELSAAGWAVGAVSQCAAQRLASGYAQE